MKRKTFVVLLACLLAVSVVVGFPSCGVKEVTCTQCQGTGKCSSCNGTGQDYANHTCGTCKVLESAIDVKELERINIRDYR